MLIRKTRGRIWHLILWIVLVPILDSGGLVYGQHFGRIVVESKTRRVSPVPGDFSFDVTRHTVPLNEFRGGGPPKDGIPSLVDPSFVLSEEAQGLHPRDMVLGVHLEGASKAYPIRILNWHEIINDRIAGRPVLVSW